MVKEVVIDGIVKAAQTKAGMLTATGGAGGMFLGLVEGISPFIPFLSFMVVLCAALFQGWISWKRWQLDQERKED